MLSSRCYSCGLKAKMPDDTKLIFVHAPKDEKGLNHYFLYCRSCHKVTDFEPPGCLSLLFGLLTLSPGFKPVGLYDPVEIQEKFPDEFGIFAPKIQQAMREDGVIK